jgi:proline racemase
MLMLKTIDAHAGGEPLRLVVDGFPAPRGQTMVDKREWARRHADRLRRALMLEPRGHADLCGSVLTEPVSPGSHAGILFMDNDGYGDLSGHGIIAAATIVLERRLLMPGGDGATIVFDTTAGAIRARAVFENAGGVEEPRRAGMTGAPDVRVERVAVTNAPSFVLHGGLAVAFGGRKIRADIAFGGAFHAIVDAEAVGVPIDAAHIPELRKAGHEISRAVEAMVDVAHPIEPRVHGIYGTVFTGPPHEEGHADLRTVGVFAKRSVNRSAPGTGASAIMAVLDAIGLLAPDRAFVCEGLVGTRLAGRVAGRTAVAEHSAVVPEIEGSAWITGEHTFYVHESDALGSGFRL